MAETLSEFFKSSDGQGKTVLVFAGNGHIVFDLGIPKRVYRRASIPYKTIVLKEWEKEMNDDLAFSRASSPPASSLWVTRPNPPEKKKPRIGVMLRDREGLKGLWIERVIPESPAEKAGLLPGDQFIAVEGKEITKVKEIHDALSEKGWGKEITFTIMRDGLKKEVKVTLPPLQE
jgi:predicted metalloprotease with PDZ domain